MGKMSKTDFATKAYDLDEMRKALVDAAGVSFGLWFSYLFVLFYLAIAVAAITHRDLFLENPVKLPFLNVDLSLLAFFGIAPLLFATVHFYVLVHFLLFSHKVGLFHAELQNQITKDYVRARLRRQLPNNIFVQLLAGPREVRTGVVGNILKCIAAITLIVAPLSLLILFQLQFLPFHATLITWSHRLVIFADLTMLWMLWPSIMRGQLTKITWTELLHQWTGLLRQSWFQIRIMRGELIKTKWTELLNQRAERSQLWWVQVSKLGALRKRSLGITIGEMRQKISRTLRRNSVGILALSSFIVALFAVAVATFPGEPIENQLEWLKWLPAPPEKGSNHWIRWTSLHEILFDGDIDYEARKSKSILTNRLILPSFDGIDQTKFDSDAKIMSLRETASMGLRHLERAVFINADLRNANFAGAHLDNVQFQGAQLQGARFDGAELEQAIFDSAQLQGASFINAKLQRASFAQAQMQGGNFLNAKLQRAYLADAQLQGGYFSDAQFEGAVLDGARFEAAYLFRANFRRASLICTQLQDTFLKSAQFQEALFQESPSPGSFRNGAQFQRALFEQTGLQGAVLGGADFEGALFKRAFVWRADPQNANMKNLRVIAAETAAKFGEPDCKPPPTPNSLPPAPICDWLPNNSIGFTGSRLNPLKPLVDEEKFIEEWKRLEQLSAPLDNFESKLFDQLVSITCDSNAGTYVMRRLADNIRTMFGEFEKVTSLHQSAGQLASFFLDDAKCANARGLSEKDKGTWRDIKNGARTPL